jgi:hypothetical protein
LTVPVVDLATGEVTLAQIFVACLGVLDDNEDDGLKR